MKVFAAQVQARRALQGQRVHGDALRPQGEHAAHGFAEAFQAVARQPGDQVHIDVAEPRPARERERFQRLRRRVLPADAPEHLVVHRLGVDADAGDPVPLQGGEAFRRHGVRPAGFHREFPAGRQVEALPDRAEQRRELLG